MTALKTTCVLLLFQVHMNELTRYNIKKIRQMKNISQGFMARRLGITQSAYSLLEKGEIKICKEKLLLIAQALNVHSVVIRSFKEEKALCLNADDDPLMGYSLESLEKIHETYSELLTEKDARIRNLERMIKKKKQQQKNRQR